MLGVLTGVVAALNLLKRVPKSIPFWAVCVLARPLEATLGDTLAKPREEVRLDFGWIRSRPVKAGAMTTIVAPAPWHSQRVKPEA